MTIFRYERLLLASAMFLGACGQVSSEEKRPADDRDSGALPVRQSVDIKRLVQSDDARAIERELPALLTNIRRSGGSIGTELASAGFAPAPGLPERYGFDRADGTSVLVTIREGRIEVRLKEISR